MHITKTAGTSVEEAGRALNVSWGRHHSASEPAYGFWHALPNTKNPSLLLKYDWFTVVRNPYDRIVSEFWCRWGGRGRPMHVNVSNFNAFIATRVGSAVGRPLGHYEAQTSYLSLLRLGPDVVLRVLRFETLRRDFARLLELSGLPSVDLPLTNTMSHPFNVSHLTPDTVQLIHRVYRSDFEVFGYESSTRAALMR